MESSPPRPVPKLVCLDLDGTLYGDDHRVSPANAAAVGRAGSAGCTIALCTGRGPTMYIPAARELGLPFFYLVGYNGAVVYKMGQNGTIDEVLFETRITAEQAAPLLTIAEGLAVEFDVRFSQYARRANDDKSTLLQRHCDLVQSKPKTPLGLPAVGDGPDECRPNKITILVEQPENFATAWQHTPAYADGEIDVVVGGPYWCETVNRTADKADGIQLVCSKLGCSLKDCLYMGDGANDASSLAACGWGIAVAGAKAQALAAADHISKWTNVQDAVARELDYIFNTAT